MEKLQVVISGDATKLISALKQSGVNIDDFAGKADKAGGSASGAGMSVNQLVTGLAGMQIAQQAAGWMQDFAVESFNAAAQSERLGTATDNLAKGIGESGESIVEAIREASRGTVGEIEAMEAANKALMFGLIENSDQMGDLTQIAITLGAAMGQDAGKSIDDLTTALGRQSPMILDNLGITLKLSDAYSGYAAALGKTAEDLTEAEKKQAFINEALRIGRQRVEELGGVQIDAATKTEITTAKWADFQVEFGRLLIEIEDSVGIFDNATAALGRLTDGAKAWQGVVRDATTIHEVNARAAEDLGIQVGYYQQSIAAGVITADQWAEAQKRAVQSLEREDEVLIRVTAQEKAMAAAQANMAWTAKEADEATQGLNQTSEEAAKLIEEQRKQVEDLMDTQARMADENIVTVGGYYRDVTDLAQESNDSQKEFIEEFADIQRQIGEATTAEKRAQLQQQLEDLRAARATELAMEEEARNELKLKTALSILETTGQLESLMDIAGVSASDAYDLITAGIVEVDAELATALQKTMGDFTSKAEEVETQAGGNAETLKSIYAGTFADIAGSSESAVNAMVSDAGRMREAYEEAMSAFDRMMAAGATSGQAADAARYTGYAGYYNYGSAQGTPAGGFTVPPGYPNDSFLVGLTSGENVSVSRGSGANGSGVTIGTLAIYANDAAGGRAAGTAFQNELRARGLI